MTEAISMKTRGLLCRSFLTPRNDGSQLWVFVQTLSTPKLSDFLLDLHQSLAHQGLAKSLDISIGMPTLFANLATSRPWHISSQKIAQLRLQ